MAHNGGMNDDLLPPSSDPPKPLYLRPQPVKLRPQTFDETLREIVSFAARLAVVLLPAYCSWRCYEIGNDIAAAVYLLGSIIALWCFFGGGRPRA